MSAAKRWVEEHFPSARGNAKAALILTYGAGLAAGLAEAQEIVKQQMVTMEEDIIAEVLAKMRETGAMIP